MKASILTNTQRANEYPRIDKHIPNLLQHLGAPTYTRRPWLRRLPAVFVASLLLATLLLAAGISLERAPLLALVPLLCAPLAVAVALRG